MSVSHNQVYRLPHGIQHKHISKLAKLQEKISDLKNGNLPSFNEWKEKVLESLNEELEHIKSYEGFEIEQQQKFQCVHRDKEIRTFNEQKKDFKDYVLSEMEKTRARLVETKKYLEASKLAGQRWMRCHDEEIKIDIEAIFNNFPPDKKLDFNFLYHPLENLNDDDGWDMEDDYRHVESHSKERDENSSLVVNDEISSSASGAPSSDRETSSVLASDVSKPGTGSCIFDDDDDDDSYVSYHDTRLHHYQFGLVKEEILEDLIKLRTEFEKSIAKKISGEEKMGKEDEDLIREVREIFDSIPFDSIKSCPPGFLNGLGQISEPVTNQQKPSVARSVVEVDEKKEERKHKNSFLSL